MNKILTIVLASLGAINTVFSIVSPILLVLILSLATDISGISLNLLFSMGLLSSLFRGIKIGFLKD